MNHGLIIPTIETREDGIEHVLGSTNLPEPVILPSGDWTAYLPDREYQNRDGVETNACTVYGTLSAIETQDRLYGEESNYSDRYVANVAVENNLLDPTRGANPHNTAEVIRQISGNVAESRAPWDDNYYGLDTAPIRDEALRWYNRHALLHKWVFLSGTPAEKRVKLQEALTKGTVCVSVSAWHTTGDLYTKPAGATDNHWVMLVNAVDDKPYEIFDSYDNFVKRLDPLYDFDVAKVYFLVPTVPLFLTSLHYGQKHPDVPALQRALIGLGYKIPNGITDYFGQETRRALSQFQETQSIIDDGSHFGPLTRYALNKTLHPRGIVGNAITFIRTIAGL